MAAHQRLYVGQNLLMLIMHRPFIFTLLLGHSLALAQENTATPFQAPVRLEAAGAPIQLEGPGYAAPTFADLDGDGLSDLIVGQFQGGHISFYKNTGSKQAPKYAEGIKITSGNKPASVPGVW